MASHTLPDLSLISHLRVFTSNFFRLSFAFLILTIFFTHYKFLLTSFSTIANYIFVVFIQIKSTWSIFTPSSFPYTLFPYTFLVWKHFSSSCFSSTHISCSAFLYLYCFSVSEAYYVLVFFSSSASGYYSLFLSIGHFIFNLLAHRLSTLGALFTFSFFVTICDFFHNFYLSILSFHYFPNHVKLLSIAKTSYLAALEWFHALGVSRISSFELFAIHSLHRIPLLIFSNTVW